MTTGAEIISPEKLPLPAVLKCLNCSYNLPLVTHAQVRNAVCSACHTLFEVQGKTLLALKRLDDAVTEPKIPVGAKGRINDVLYQVTGFILYQERDSYARWREYVLFNPVTGYALLSEYNGHWNFFQIAADFSCWNMTEKTLHYRDAEFRLFHSYHATVVFAAGEFSWRITEGNPHYAEFIAPPYILTRIVSEKEISWLLGEYQEPEKIRAAFGVKALMPARIDVGATEVFHSGFSFAKVKKLTFWAVGIICVLQLCFVFLAEEKTVAQGNYNLPDVLNTENPKPIVGKNFTINTGILSSSNLKITLEAPVSNDWFGANIILFNKHTGQEFGFDMGVEYYSGYDGESWSEGSQEQSQVLSALPDGEYEMLIQPYVSGTGSYHSFNLQVVHDVPLWNNFWVILGLMVVIPGIQFIREQRFEHSRWMNSDYSPYNL